MPTVEPAHERGSDHDFSAHWTAWAQVGGPTGGNRPEALRRLRSWSAHHRANESLVLSDLGLTDLPKHLPAQLSKLDVRNNKLSALPECLPNSLLELNATKNRLTQLPTHLPGKLTKLAVRENQLGALPDSLPKSLVNLDVSRNLLARLPENLPASLQALDSCNCQLVALPARLPVSLRDLDVSNNCLTSLPENILTRLGRGCQVDLSDNPLAQSVRENLSELVCTPGYRGPHFFFSMISAGPRVAAPPLGSAVAQWFAPGDGAAARKTWQSFSNEIGASDFSQFLTRLGNTSRSVSPQLKLATASWLSQLANRAQLRTTTFLISQDASTSCEDRVLLTYNDMKKVRLASDVENGDYDKCLPNLITLARGMFRLDKLETIAREKVKTLRMVDEVEVYLAYQVKLRERLDLPVDTAEMRFFDVSCVTQAEIDAAEVNVRAAEADGFFQYLSTDWAPWQSILKRLDPQAYAAAEDKLIGALAGTEFEHRLNEQLQAANLNNDSDARITLGAQVQAEITREVNGELTRAFLLRLGQSDLLTLRSTGKSEGEAQQGFPADL